MISLLSPRSTQKRTDTLNCAVSCAMIILFAAFFTGCSKRTQSRREDSDTAVGHRTGDSPPAIPQVPHADVRIVLAVMPHYNWSVVGAKKGWFEDVGITVRPKLFEAGSHQKMIAGEIDLVVGASWFSTGVRKRLPVKNFCNASMYIYNSVVAGPEYKTVADFVAQGHTQRDAVRLTIQQLRGKRWTYPPYGILAGWVPLVLKLGDLEVKDIEPIVAIDTETARVMLAGKADVQAGGVGGAGARLLLARGFRPILVADDIREFVRPSADSIELRAFGHEGWLASDKWLSENRELALRFCSVTFRFVDFLRTHPDEVMSIHLPFLNSISGGQFTEEEYRQTWIKYSRPYTFEEQSAFYLDDNSPFNVKYLVGSYIKLNEELGTIEHPGDVKVEDSTVADKVYNELRQLRQNSDSAIESATNLIEQGKISCKDMTQAEGLLRQAKFFYNIYDFLDSHRFATSAVEWAKYSSTHCGH